MSNGYHFVSSLGAPSLSPSCLEYVPGTSTPTTHIPSHPMKLVGVVRPSLRRLPRPPRLLLLGRHGPQLQRVDPALARHLVAQQAVDEAVARRLAAVRREGRRRDDDAKVRLARRAAGHGGVVGVQVRVVVDLEGGGLEGGCDLCLGEGGLGVQAFFILFVSLGKGGGMGGVSCGMSECESEMW